ncbi:response regulator transcription factor [Allostreptomyces psammosilenae]|uniref:DNA-binding NarL/FixJ family response regulator n=1 Tax=Allostreptomyces psammosilenae TaxID=1892865 RepID=A0A853A135_9ACTN|nr:response regulator transcription factor [Allostreptomyces psammosilenae]NYI08333.1 DNA-binding NarL/FixJ family response regulator [Allostreptomyces psammosilenae]
MVKVLVVDDEALIRAGLRAVIDAEPDLTVVGEAADGGEVVPLVRETAPDVVLMDVRMPRMDGIAATRELLAAVPEAPPKVLVVTTFENDEYVYEALRVGASGFLLKRARAEQMVQAIRVVAAGDSLLFPTAIRDLATRHGGGGRALPRLTEREAGVLRLVAKGLTNAEIADELGVGTETVKTHLGNVLSKLGARDRTQAVIIAYESGFVDR